MVSNEVDNKSWRPARYCSRAVSPSSHGLKIFCLSTSLRRQTVIWGGARVDRTEQNAGEEFVLVPALVEAEHELVQVSLKVLRADPVEGSA